VNKRPHGQIRKSQVVTTFGPGAPLDLPDHSVLVGGLEHWSLEGREQVQEPRLVAKLMRIFPEVPQLRLFAPPPEQDDPTKPQTGITAWQFPEWFVTQHVYQDGEARLRRLVRREHLTKGQFYDDDRKMRPVVPIRFVRACVRGHIDDIEWRVFVHRGVSNCPRELWIEERGTSGDLSEISVRCSCGQRRSVYEAVEVKLFPLGMCNGKRPWLGPYTSEGCDMPFRLLPRSASNAYFPQTMSVISLPDRSEALVKAVDGVWQDHLEYVETVEDLAKERRRERVRNGLEGFTDAEVFEEVQARKGIGMLRAEKPVKQAELEVLLASSDEIGADRPEGNFYARALPAKLWTGKPFMSPVEKVVLVHRLREVVAQVGFTRFESISPDMEGELEIGVRRASLARELSWLPAIENRGEGIFIAFRKEAIQAWSERAGVKARGKVLLSGFDQWKVEHKGAREFFPLPYIFLHSLSHLLLTAVSLECGYPASSLRERIYASDSGHGILLYTGSPDAEGTLGGLIQVGKRIHEHLASAIELGRLCSNDPVCAQHDPSSPHEHRYLQGAACHGCLLIAETSCEQRNDYLDRALVVPTVDNCGAEFFSGEGV